MIDSLYTAQQLEAKSSQSGFKQIVTRISLLRVAWFFLGLAAIWATFSLENVLLTEVAILAFIVVFGVLVRIQGKYEKRYRYFSALLKIISNEALVKNGGKNIYGNGAVYNSGVHPYTSDLDIYGEASLFALINRGVSPKGEETLAEWLAKPALPEEIRARQEAVRELAQVPDWRFSLQSFLWQGKEDTYGDEISKLFAFMNQDDKSSVSWLATYVKYLPWLMAVLCLATLVVKPVGLLLVLVGFINMVLVFFFSADVNRTASLVTKAGNTFDKYSDAFDKIEQETFHSAKLKNMQQAIGRGNDRGLSFELKRLAAIIQRLDYRLNVFLGVLLNIVLAWDIRQYVAMHIWKHDNKELLRDAFDILGVFESLISLASLHFNHSDWVLPEIVVSADYTFIAKGLGHPLIPESNLVRNDFTLDNTRTVDIITGSNMAGKSTFQRTMGINMVLAMAGAPVCAHALKVSPMRVFTYMRIKDSLNENTSTFKAELDRLAALMSYVNEEEKVYFLVDEMLRGTNSADKYRGSKAIIEKLIAEKAVGCVATHDLMISELEQDYPDYVRNFYFDIEVRDGEMTFDYLIKHGVCKTFNASLLLKQLGIEMN